MSKKNRYTNMRNIKMDFNPIPSRIATVCLILLFPLIGVATAQSGISKDGLLFNFQTSNDEVFALDKDGKPLTGYQLTPKRRAHNNREGQLVVHEGYFEAELIAPQLTNSLRKTSEFSVEISLTPYSTEMDVPKVIFSFGKTLEQAILAFVQWRDQLRVIISGSESQKAIDFGSVTPGVQTQISITYSENKITVYQNGRLVTSNKDFAVDTSMWKAASFTIGDTSANSNDWSGTVEGLSLWSRALSPDEVKEHVQIQSQKVASRPPVTTLKIEGTLISKSDITTIEDLAPYTQGLVVFEYTIDKILEGEYKDGPSIYVAHWCILDSEAIPFNETELNTKHSVTLELFRENRQLESEYLSDYVIEDFTLPLYYDVGGLAIGLAANMQHSKAASAIESPTATTSIEVKTPARQNVISTGNKESTEYTKFKNELEVIGGWEKWNKQVEPFRKDVADLRASLKANKVPVAISPNDYFFSTFGLSYMLDSQFVYRAGQEGNPEAYTVQYKNIIDFHKQLAERDIHLVFVPIPTRMELLPREVSNHVPSKIPVAPQRKQLLMHLAEAGVDVVDLLPAFETAQAKTGDSLCSKHDSHWNVEGIKCAADYLAKHLSESGYLKGVPSNKRSYSTKTILVNRRGNLVKHLPDSLHAKYASDTVPVEQVLVSGKKYTDAEKSPIVIVGDSYTYFYEDHSGNISAHLAKDLGMPVSLLSSARGGPSAPRSIARQGADYLKGRKVVIWMMVSRYLIDSRANDWQTATLP